MATHPALENKEFNEALQRVIRHALDEDIGAGDITSTLLIPEGTQAELRFVPRGTVLACGVCIPRLVYGVLDKSVTVGTPAEDGQLLNPGDIMAIAKGSARSLLAGERVALNLMQRMSGVATLTHRYVEAVAGTQAVILDTRKTMPGLRLLDKYATRTGGAQNHRMRLDDMVLIKDNHIALCGDIAKAVTQARAGSHVPVVVECDTLKQVQEALAAKPDRILLDNMSLQQLGEAVGMAAGKLPLEASGNVSLETVRAIAQTGVDFISIGRLTHSAPAADIGADLMIAG